MTRQSGSILSLLIILLGGCASPGGDDPGRPGDATQIGNLVVSGVPEVPESLTERLRQYQNTRSASVRGWVGDELLIATPLARPRSCIVFVTRWVPDLRSPSSKNRLIARIFTS